MTTPLAHVAFVIDDSSSMAQMAQGTMKAFNAYIDTLKKVKGAEIRLSVFKLNFIHHPLQFNAHIQDAITLNHGNYNADYGTPLSLNIPKAIERVREELRNSGPRKVVLCIQTDGMDDYVRERDVQGAAGRAVREAIKEGWEVVFMAAGAANPASAAQYERTFTNYANKTLGIPLENIMIYGPDDGMIVKAFSETAMNIGAFASGRAKTAAFKSRRD